MRKFAFIALLMLCAISSAAFAQEATPQATPQFCGTLSDTDCAILSKSQQVMASLSSASFDLQVDATFTNIPDMPGPLKLNIVGNVDHLRDDADLGYVGNVRFRLEQRYRVVNANDLHNAGRWS